MTKLLEEITIRTTLKPGDLGTIIKLHGELYASEHAWGIGFESYVATGLAETYQMYNPERSRFWIAEDEGKIIGSLVLLDRDDAAQLRYYLVMPEYRGLGLGKRLMELFMAFLDECGYHKAFLWTTANLGVAATLYERFGFVLTQRKSSVAFGSMVEEQKYEWRKQ